MIHETVFRHSRNPGDQRLLNERSRLRARIQRETSSQVVKSMIASGLWRNGLHWRRIGVVLRPSCSNARAWYRNKRERQHGRSPERAEGGWTGRGGGGSVHGSSLGSSSSRCSHTAVFAVVTTTVDVWWHHAAVVSVEILKFSRCLDTGNTVSVTVWLTCCVIESKCSNNWRKEAFVFLKNV